MLLMMGYNRINGAWKQSDNISLFLLILAYDCNGECGSGENAVDLLHSGELKDGETVTIRVGITGNSGSTVFTPPITVTISENLKINRQGINISNSTFPKIKDQMM